MNRNKYTAIPTLVTLTILVLAIALVSCATTEPAAPSRDQFHNYLTGGGIPAANVAVNAEGPGAPVVYDYDGHVKDMAWLWSEFGDVSYVRTDPHPDTDYVFRVVAFRAKCGPAALIVKVIDEVGAPLEKFAIIRHWPGAPDLPDFSGTTAKQWTKTGIVGKTNAEGDVGFGMGTGDYYWPDTETGASKVYVADFDGYGDLVSGLGMLAATDHCHVDTTFQRVPIEVGPTPEPPTPTPGPNPPTPEPGSGWDIHFDIDGSISPKQ